MQKVQKKKKKQKKTFSCSRFGNTLLLLSSMLIFCCFAFTLIESKRNGNEVAHKIFVNLSKINKIINERVEKRGGNGQRCTKRKLNKIPTKQMEFSSAMRKQKWRKCLFLLLLIICILFTVGKV